MLGCVPRLFSSVFLLIIHNLTAWLFALKTVEEGTGRAKKVAPIFKVITKQKLFQ
jgi:hypothetical protein